LGKAQDNEGNGVGPSQPFWLSLTSEPFLIHGRYDFSKYGSDFLMEKRLLNIKIQVKKSMLAALIVAFVMATSFPAAALERQGRWLKYNGTYPYLVGYDLQQLFFHKEIASVL